MMVKTLFTGIIVIFTVSCGSKSDRRAEPAVDSPEACYQRGPDFRWQNNSCIQLTPQEACESRSGYIWQNGMCVAGPHDAYNECQRRGGQWVNGQCLEGDSQYSQCQQLPSFKETLQCVERSAQSFGSILEAQAQSVRNLEKAVSSLNRFREKATRLISLNVTSDMSGLAKAQACWDTTVMTNELKELTVKLEFSDPVLMNRTSAFVDGMRGAISYLQDHINCPIKIR